MPRRPAFRDNARMVLAATAAAVLLFVAIETLLRKSRDFSPDFLASVLLYGLTVLNLTLLLVLLLVLGRNLVRALMERRRGVLGARFRMRLLLVFLLISIGPSTLLLAVGSDLIRQTVDRWFSVDVERILSSSQALAVALHDQATEQARTHARLLARELETRRLLEPEGRGLLRRTVELRARDLRLDLVSVFGTQGELVGVMDPGLPPAHGGEPAESLVAAALGGREATAASPRGTGELIRVAVPVRSNLGTPQGAVVVSRFLPGPLVAEAREVRERYTKFREAEASKGPIVAFYISLYMLPALLVLFGAVWLSLYLARRITTPIRIVAEGAERIAAGERGVRVDFAAGDDEFRALIESFNRMSERLARSEEEVVHSRAGLTRKNQELEERRRLMETVLETVGTGVLVVDAECVLGAANAAASSLLDLGSDAVGRSLPALLQGPGGEDIVALVERQLAGRGSRQEREVSLGSEGRERHLLVTVVPLPGRAGSAPGAVVVLDDLTPLMRAQRVAAWGEVARKLAHEIKNPLTPIQLSAQRIRRAHVKQAPDFERVVGECTRSIEREVEALKNLVDEFAQFARLPAVHLAPASLDEVVQQTLSLYDGQFSGVRFDKRLAPDLPMLRLDAAQMKRVLINLLDNAIEATQRRGIVEITTEFDRPRGRVRLGVADDGPGISPEDREKLFVPHFSTKKRGSGLGLAIVNRIVQDHHGHVHVEQRQPTGMRFVVELPV